MGSDLPAWAHASVYLDDELAGLLVDRAAMSHETRALVQVMVAHMMNVSMRLRSRDMAVVEVGSMMRSRVRTSRCELVVVNSCRAGSVSRAVMFV